MTPELLIFLALAIIAVASAAGLLFSRNTVYCALFLIINFTSVGVIYLIMGAPFIALAQTAVYAGAIMVLFLFVIMLLGIEELDRTEPLRWQRPLAIILAAAIILEGGYVLMTRVGLGPVTLPMNATLSDPKTIGMVLFTRFSLPFEITSVILLVAAIGAVVLTRVKPAQKEE